MSESKAFCAGKAQFFAAAFLFLMTPALAQTGENTLNLPPAPFKPPTEGTKLMWKSASGEKTSEQIFTGTKGLKVEYHSRGKDRSAYIACWNCTARGGTEIDLKAYGSLWPLTVGKTATFDRVSGTGSWQNKITVDGTENLTTPFGEVATYRVVNESRSNNTSWEGVRIYWYAPSIGYIIKFKSTDSENNNSEWVVTDVTTP